jgi:DNA-binding SARP family transcriptional activator
VLRELIDARPTDQVAGPARISLLGTLMVSVPGRARRAISWQGYKAASLLGFLLMHRGRNFTKEDLVRQLWPGAAPAKAFNRLFATISRLNAAVGGPVVLGPGGYAIAVDDARVSLDADEFTECHRLAVTAVASPARRLEAIRRCLALYRGPLLRSVGDVWAEPFRHSFHVKHLQVLRAAIEAEAAHGNWAASTEAARRLVEAEPGNEQAATALLTGLGRMGLRTDMVRSFAQICRRLRAQRRVPGPAMLREYQHLLG